MGRVSVPEFTQASRGEAVENRGDENRILADRDETNDEPTEFMNVENEPADFIRGEVDVKTQMDRAANALDSSVRGIREKLTEGLQTHGLEEVEAKTDKALAQSAASQRVYKKKPLH